MREKESNKIIYEIDFLWSFMLLWKFMHEFVTALQLQTCKKDFV